MLLRRFSRESRLVEDFFKENFNNKFYKYLTSHSVADTSLQEDGRTEGNGTEGIPFLLPISTPKIDYILDRYFVTFCGRVYPFVTRKILWTPTC